MVCFGCGICWQRSLLRSQLPISNQRSDALARLPDSALSMPANLRMATLPSTPRNSMAMDPAIPQSTRIASLGTIRRTSMAGNVRQGYNNFCDNMSAKIWDNPNGRRITFDSRGRPGVAVEIPIR